MHQNLAIILLQFNYIKNSFIVLIPSLLIYNFHAKYYLEKSKSYLTMRAIDSGIAAYLDIGGLSPITYLRGCCVQIKAAKKTQT